MHHLQKLHLHQRKRYPDHGAPFVDHVGADGLANSKRFVRHDRLAHLNLGPPLLCVQPYQIRQVNEGIAHTSSTRGTRHVSTPHVTCHMTRPHHM